MQLIYIAGPFRAKTPWLVEQNIRKAEEVALEVWKQGAVPVCPHTMNRFFDKEVDDEVVLKGTLELLTRCDALLLLPGWHESEGCRNEAKVAAKENIPTFVYNHDRLPEWLRESK